MKIAILVQCHKNPKQINRFLKVMKYRDICFYIHVDRKSSIKDEIIEREDIFILPDSLRVDVEWSKISQVDATINLLRYAQETGHYDFFWVCSGQDFPIKSPDYIYKWFLTHRDNDFVGLFASKNNGLKQENNYDKRNAIFFPEWMLGKEVWRRVIKRFYTQITGGYRKTISIARRTPVNKIDFYFGSQWICLTNRTLIWIEEYQKQHPEYYKYFKNCNCPDESFFQTLVMNSPFASFRNDNLHFVEWQKGKNSPRLLRKDDYNKLMASEKLMARKFDELIDEDILFMIEKKIYGL